MSQRLKSLADAGVSIWLDDLSRERLETGNLARLLADLHVVGVTTNPTIFAAALADGGWYDDQLLDLAARGVDVDDAVFELTTTDVRRACDLLHDTYVDSGGMDGRVSIEVSPRLASDTAATVRSARALWAAVDRPNVLVKVPATDAGLPAITAILGQGISVNVTLIFGLQRYREVVGAYFAGLEQAADVGVDLATVHSVASFFVSRVDTEVDRRLQAAGSGADLKGQAALANARLAYAMYQEMFSGERFAQLRARGAHVQRPLWASTGVKNPAYRDTMYVTDLVVAGTVNTMPEETLLSFADHGSVHGDQVTVHGSHPREIMDRIADAGVEYEAVIATLEREGVEKFVASWDELCASVGARLRRPQPTVPPSVPTR